ncbi:MAG: hypothetical protein ACE5I0_09930 [Candidatus Binatia bacterium]
MQRESRPSAEGMYDSDELQEGSQAEELRTLPQRLQKRLADLAMVLERVAIGDLPVITEYVDKLREQNPGISNDDLARKIVRRKAIKNALFGAITGAPGFTLMPLTIPADLARSRQYVCK